MLAESSTTIAIATDAPPLRPSATREQRTSGPAPSSAMHKIISARNSSTPRSSSRLRSRAVARVTGTKLAGGKICGLARPRRSRCANEGQDGYEAHSSVSRPMLKILRTSSSAESLVLQLSSRPPRGNSCSAALR